MNCSCRREDQHSSRPEAWENGYCENFNSKLRDELLNGEIFYSLTEAKVIEAWRAERPAPDLTPTTRYQDDVVHTLTPDRSDQPFGKAILPKVKLVRWACPGCPWRAVGV